MLDTNNSSLEPRAPRSHTSGMERSSFDKDLSDSEGRQDRVRSNSISWDLNEPRTSIDVTQGSELPLNIVSGVNSYPYPQNNNLFMPFGNAVDAQKYQCVMGHPYLPGLRFHSVMIKPKQVPFNMENFICRPALGCVDHQIEVELPGFNQEHFRKSFKQYRMKHCRKRCRRHGKCPSRSLSVSSTRSASRKTSKSSLTSSRHSSSRMPSLHSVKLDHLKGAGKIGVSPQKTAKRAKKKVSLGCNNSNSSTKERSPPVESFKWKGRVVHVLGDGRCLFRSLVVSAHEKLQKCKRDEYGRPDNEDDDVKEKEMADELRAKVVSFMKDNLHFYSQLENELINADQPSAKRFGKFKDRLEAMSLSYTMPGELELNAASCVLEQIIVVLNTDLEIISVYGDDRYPQSQTLSVRFTRLGEDVGHYDAVVLQNDQDGAKNSDCFKKVVRRLQRRESLFNNLIEYMTRMETDAGKLNLETDEKDTRSTDKDPRTDRLHLSHNVQKFGTNNNKLEVIRSPGLVLQASVSASTQTSKTDCGALVGKRPAKRRNRRKPAKGSKKRRSGRAKKRKAKKVARDRNCNRRSSRTRQKRARSLDSDVSCERQRKYRRIAVATRRSKPCPRNSRAAKTKRGQKSYARRTTKRRTQVRTRCVRYFLVNPPAKTVKDTSELDINRPQPSHLPDAFAGGTARCFMCHKFVGANMSSALLKCYICGRFAHKECAVRESSAWGHGQVDDNYFLCKECVAE